MLKHVLQRGTNSRLAKGFIATLLGSGTAKVILAAATFLFTHIMTKEEFGEFSFVRNTLNTILCMSALNFTSLCTKFSVEAIAGDEKGFPRLFHIFVFSLVVCATVGLALLILPSSIIAFVIPTSVSAYFKVIGLLLPVFIIHPLIEGIMRGMEDFKLIGYLQTIFAVLFVALVFFGYRIGGVNGAVLGIVVYYSSFSIVCFLYLYKRYPYLYESIKNCNHKSERDVITKMVLPIFFMSFFEAPILWIAQLLLSKYDSMGAVGSMTAIMQLRNLAVLIPSYFANTFLTFATEMRSGGRIDEYYHKYRSISMLFLLAGIPVFLVFMFGGKFLLSLYGSEYISDTGSLVIASAGIPIFMLINIFRIDLIIQEHQKYLFYISIVWNVIWILSLYILLRLQCPALQAFFISQLIGWAVNLVGYYIMFHRDKNKSYENRNLHKHS